MFMIINSNRNKNPITRNLYSIYILNTYMYLLFTLKKDEKIIFYKICAVTKLKLKLLFKSNHI